MTNSQYIIEFLLTLFEIYIKILLERSETMNKISETISKIEENKKIKKEKLLDAAFSLFTDKGIYDTSITNIVDKAGVAKGTFYLYFKDKWDINEKLILEKTQELFNDAINKTKKKNLDNFPDKLISVIDYIIDNLSKNKEISKLINKNLSIALYNKNIIKLIDEKYSNLKEIFIEELKKYDTDLENPNVKLYMIVELVGGCCYTSILYNEPLPINELKPYLYKEIRNMLN